MDERHDAPSMPSVQRWERNQIKRGNLEVRAGQHAEKLQSIGCRGPPTVRHYQLDNEEQYHLREHAAPGNERPLKRTDLTLPRATSPHRVHINRQDFRFTPAHQEHMAKLMHENNHHETEPEQRNKFKAGKNEGAERHRPMRTDRNATPMSKGKIAVLSHRGIEPYFGDMRNVAQFGVLKKLFGSELISSESRKKRGLHWGAESRVKSAYNAPMSDVIKSLPSSVALRRLPVVAIVGRPNAGKSTLFNRLLRQQKAVVDNTPGVTRDRNFSEAQWDGIPFILVDTGGIEFRETDNISAQVQAQTLLAITEADFVIFLFDGREGLNPADADAVDLLRRNSKPTFFVVNKIDGDRQEASVADFSVLGLDPLFTISSAHGRGIGELMEAVTAAFPSSEEPTQDASGVDAESATKGPLRIAIVGRPNVGKSSLLNRLVGDERSIVDSTPGTTRDAVDSLTEWNGKPIVLVDTAGARRRARVHERIEHASVLIALRALERAEVGLLVIDAVEGMTDQDVRLARYAWDRGRGLILVVNKWDVVSAEKKNQARYVEELRHFFPITTSLPVVFLSALTGARISKLLPMVEQVAQAHARQIPTAQLNRAFQEWTTRTPPPSYHGRQPRIFYVTQVGIKPPCLAIFTSAPEGITPAYTRYLENQLREQFDLAGTPIKLSFRSRRKEEGEVQPKTRRRAS